MTETAHPRRGAILRLLESRPAAVGLAAGIALVGLVPQFLSRTLPDISYLLYAAGRVIDGARLYVDLLEINPPLIVWLNMPVVAVARLLGASEITAYRLAVTALLVASVLACRWLLLHTSSGADPVQRRGIILLLVFSLFVLPRLDWGEREHLTLALTLPYLLLAIARLQGRTTGRLATTAIGLGAAVGIAIKPYFVALWFAREGLLALAGRTRGPTPEGWVIVAAGFAYAAAVAIVTPEYFALAGELGGAYQRFIHNPLLVTALLGDGAALSIGALLLAAGLWRHVTAGELRVVLIAGIAAFYLAAVMQLKGWRYHFYPALALSWLLLVLLSLRLHRPLFRWTERLFAAAAGAGALLLAALVIFGCLAQAARPLDPRYDADPSVGQLIPVVRQRSAGQDVIVLSPNMASGFPLTTYSGARWPLRFQHLWPLVAAYDSAIASPSPLILRDSAHMTSLERRVVDVVAEDMMRSTAPLMLVLRTGPDEPRWGMRRLDLLEFLSRDDRIARKLAEYEPAGVVGQYEVYQRRGGPALSLAVPTPGGSIAAAPGQPRVMRGAPFLLVMFALLLGGLYRREAGWFSRPGDLFEAGIQPNA